jgi:hypothetical protein
LSSLSLLSCSNVTKAGLTFFPAIFPT